jgi:GH15 family glucan-1,4-alpha-glucosidase
METLFTRSIEIILENQLPSGGYIASPHFNTYRYCWFRDGAFIAYSMDLVGEHSSAAGFHDWGARTLNQRADLIKRAVDKGRLAIPLKANEILHTRYTLDGDDGDEEWPNNQLDGFGTWLWVLGEHIRLDKTPLKKEWIRAAQLVASYISTFWKSPCFDCWEENPNKIHTYTLAAIYAGLRSHSAFSDADHNQTLNEIRDFLWDDCVVDGRFVKFVGTNIVDANLLGLAIPYRVIDLDDPTLQATVAEIELKLRHGGGVHRYEKDTYYGGGEWILLAAWLGWYYNQIGEENKAKNLQKWVESHADSKGYLPEQIPVTLNDPSFYQPWRDRWGEIAKPLLWSHAKYLILSVINSSRD